MLTHKEIIAKIEENKEKIKSFGVTQLILFGSHATGEATEQSDLDFLVEFKKDRGLFDDYIELLQLLEALFGKKIDLVKTHLVREELREDILGGVQIAAKI
ncbi:MAG: nucleotidyltransferase domain-containing protein [Candidatus Woesearchaeota archaeon]|nr:nucleotidyltransferase domain-containing protein [Candidatus Woesearchaeota archaeon]